jgi:glycosyltransferase involved in cell wall biosynthesis
MSPTISIITITYNSDRHLDQTIESVAAQSYADRELIIVDGDSTDGTLDIVRRHGRDVDQLISEPDRGIADAMNKGLGMAKGEFVLFLHSDDYLLSPTSLADAAPHLAGPNPVVGFQLFYEMEDGARVLPRKPQLNWRINFKMSLHHQAVFCRTSLLEDLGGFDEAFKIAMDYEFFLRAYRRGIRATSYDLPIAVMRKTGISSQLDNESLLARFREEKRVHLRHADTSLWRAIYRAYWFAYPVYRGFRPSDFSSAGTKQEGFDR